MKQRFFSIGRKLALIIMVLVSVGLISLTFIQTNQQRELLKKTVSQDYQVIAELLAGQLSGAFRWAKPQAIEQSFNNLYEADNQSVAAIYAMTAQGEVLFSSESTNQTNADYLGYVSGIKELENKKVQQLDNTIVVSVPVYAGKNSSYAGVLSVAWSLEAMEKNIQAALLWQYLLGLCVVLVVVFALVFLVRALVSKPIAEVCQVANEIAKGNLTIDIPVVSKNNEIGLLLNALKKMQETLTDVIESVKQEMVEVNRYSTEMVVGNDELCHRTEKQASHIESIASNMQQMTATTKQNAVSLLKANELANEAQGQAKKGGSIVDDVVSAMKEIDRSSKKVDEIINIIEGIAFQTNLLSLNAAVEAARAGDRGRGFAVVAAEVGSLAKRSASSAKQIAELLKENVRKVEDGSRLANTSGESLQRIIESISQVNGIIADISMSGQEQSKSIEQVSQAIIDMDRSTQENVALVEQVTANSKSMSDSAKSVHKAMDYFKTVKE